MKDASSRDLLIPMAVVTIIGMMIVPLPAVALDVLLAANIALALLFLITSVYLTDSKGFTSLPTILLLATLFRLGLNISTTRQILSSGTAPDVIVAFGNFVVGGNLIVGVVIFLIITLIQFLVIAKGAERVAEVAARFTLDAMPGKQMSIDADLRAGAIGLTEARELRRGLQTESKLFGALDGAMKFVKGDAIAGLLISFVNICAGVLVGISQQNLSAVDALSKYSLYTVGDGLVSQIPALLVAVAAGIAVTRVDDGSNRFVGRLMVDQLCKEPQALGTCAFVLLILAMMPGLPTLPFLTGSFALGFVAYRIVQGRRQKAEGQLSVFRPKVSGQITLHISDDALSVLHEDRSLPDKIEHLREQHYERWGCLISEIQFDVKQLPETCSAIIYFKGVPHTKLKAVATDTAEKLNTQIIQALNSLFEQHRSELIDDTQTRIILEMAASNAEDLVNSVIPEVISVTSLTKLFRRLLDEGISIRNVRSVLQAIAETAATLESHSGVISESSLNVVLENVRVALSREICFSLASDSWELEFWRLTEDADKKIAESVVSNQYLEHSELAPILRSISEKENPTIVCSSLSRGFLAQILSEENPGASVLSADEIVAEVQLKLLGEVGGHRPQLKVA